jgi:hypothetical protein
LNILANEIFEEILEGKFDVTRVDVKREAKKIPLKISFKLTHIHAVTATTDHNHPNALI